MFSFADHSRETVLIWQNGIFTRERKYAQTKYKYLDIALNGAWWWKAICQEWDCFPALNYFTAGFPSNCKSHSFLVPQCTSLCILSGRRSWHFYLVAQELNLHISLGFLFSPLNLCSSNDLVIATEFCCHTHEAHDKH